MPDTPHLTPVELANFWALDLEEARFREFVEHLARGCPDCCGLAGQLPWPSEILSRPAANDDERAKCLENMLDFRLRSRMKKTLALGFELAEARDQAKAEVEGLIELDELPSRPTQMLLFARARAWLTEARGERREDPERCLFAAVLAASFSGSVKPEEHPDGEVANLRSETWTEVANARRLTGDFESAEAAFHRAAATATEMAPLLESAEAAAHFLLASRRFAEAEDLLTFLQGIRERRGERHEAGRICLERGIVAQLRQDDSAALHLFLRSLQLLDLANHPDLAPKQARYEQSERKGAGLGSRWTTAALLPPQKRSFPLSVAAWRPTFLSKRSKEALFGVNRAHFFQRVLVFAEKTESLRQGIVV